MKHNDFMMI